MDNSRLEAFQLRHGVGLLHRLGLGPGQDGVVLQSTRLTAVKFFDRPERYARELEVYRVLRRSGIRFIAGHNVPELLLEDDQLHAIEISIVQRPFILDFAGALRNDEVPDFEPSTVEEHHEHLRELFGARWSEALCVAEAFRIATGYLLLDIHPGNIALPDQ